MKRHLGVITNGEPRKKFKPNGGDEKSMNLNEINAVDGTTSHKQSKRILKANINKPRNNVLEKPDWKVLKEKKKELLHLRKSKQNKNLYDTCKAVKLTWEMMRRNKNSSDKQKKYCTQIMQLLEGKMNMIIRSHDMTRVIQSLIKHGSPEIRDAISAELGDNIVKLASSKYSTHTVHSLLQYSSMETKKRLISHIIKNTRLLISKKLSASLLNYVHNKVANRSEKIEMRNNLLGLVGQNGEDFNSEKHSINFSEDTESIINKLVNKSYALRNPVVHSALLIYLKSCNEHQKKELIENLKVHFREIMTSSDGCKVMAIILWHSSSKDKKTIIKNIKPDVVSIITEEFSSTTFMQLLDATDDTVLVKKILYPGILSSIYEIVASKYGRRVFLYIITHRDPMYFYNHEIKEFEWLDTSPLIKKDLKLKFSELKEDLLEKIVQEIIKNPDRWFYNGSISLFSSEVIKHSEGDSQVQAFESFIKYIFGQTEIEIEEGNVMFKENIERPEIHIVFKNLLKNDKLISSKKSRFSYLLLKKLKIKVIKRWVTLNRGCFSLLLLLELKLKSDEELREQIKSQMKTLECNNTKGAELLLKELSS